MEIDVELCKAAGPCLNNVLSREARSFSVASCSVRPSVRHVLVAYIQTAEDIIKFLSWPGSPVVFLSRSPLQNSKGNPFCSGSANYRGVFAIFR